MGAVGAVAREESSIYFAGEVPFAIGAGMAGEVAQEEGSGFVEGGMTLAEWWATFDVGVTEEGPRTPHIKETTRSVRDAYTTRRPRTL